MKDKDRKAEDIRAEIDKLIGDYEALTGEKLVVHGLKEHQPQEIWDWIASLSKQYSVLTGKTLKFEAGSAASEATATGARDRSTDEQPSDEPSDDLTIYCSFCGKSQVEVTKPIAGPMVFICNECVALSMMMPEPPAD